MAANTRVRAANAIEAEMPTEKFRSKEAYRRWSAYRHIHGIKAPHLRRVTVAGKTHTVKHSSTGRKSRRTVRRKGKRS